MVRGDERTPAPPPPGADVRVAAEAERLAREAARLRDEAERAVTTARAVAQAAAMAAEALRLLAGGGPAEASRRLDEALALERSATGGAAGDESKTAPFVSAQGPAVSEPASRAAPGANGAGGQPAARGAPISSFPAPSFPAPSFPVPGARAAPPPLGMPPRSAPPASLGDPKISAVPGSAPVPSYLKGRAPLELAIDPGRGPAFGAAPPRSLGLPGIPPAALSTGDALAFRSRLQPTLFGMPRAVAVIVGVSVFILVLGLLFLIFS
jgi:serine/threonine-protein kinase